jgi:hypothetical protein
LAYLCAPDKYAVTSNALAKAHGIAMAGIELVQGVMQEHRQLQHKLNTASTVHLQDAWLKPIVVPTKAYDVEALVESDTAAVPPAAKRQRTLHLPRTVLRTRILLTAGRKTPSNLVAALQSKGVKLIRPPPSGAGSCVQLEFEQAFFMTIYFVPLLVTLRAYRATPKEENENDDTLSSEHQWKCGSWTPLHYGLPDREELTVGGVTVKGTYETVGLAVEERLRDASARATQALRTCFTNTASAAVGGGDFEQELLEASALLEFVQLARDTYTPHWKDEPDEAAANS